MITNESFIGLLKEFNLLKERIRAIQPNIIEIYQLLPNDDLRMLNSVGSTT